ncbi:MAG: hypothetical protein K2N78_09875 [Oscillospiraceae bacterium]|nr:hypothetical protein [Oscillospiraceae bacterium]
MDNHIFRSAALGFNRQDVMDYIEKVQKEAETKTTGLEAQLDAARQEGDASRQALEDCMQKLTRLNAELAELKERYAAETDARGTAELESDQQRSRLQALESENRRLTARTQELESQMESLRRDKERLTQLELDARRRADELMARAQTQADDLLSEAAARGADIQTQAQAHADTLMTETRRQIAYSVEKCEDLLRSYEIVASHISSELQKMDATVSQLPAGLNHLKQGLAELIGPEGAL